jgi:hypothetical protein
MYHRRCETAFVSSASFPEAARERDIDVGLLIRSTSMARHPADHLPSMVDRLVLKPIGFVGR